MSYNKLCPPLSLFIQDRYIIDPDARRLPHMLLVCFTPDAHSRPIINLQSMKLTNTVKNVVRQAVVHRRVKPGEDPYDGG